MVSLHAQASGTVGPSEEARWSAAADSRTRDGEGCPPHPQTRNLLLCLTYYPRPRDRQSSRACSRIQPCSDRSTRHSDKVQQFGNPSDRSCTIAGLEEEAMCNLAVKRHDGCCAGSTELRPKRAIIIHAWRATVCAHELSRSKKMRCPVTGLQDLDQRPTAKGSRPRPHDHIGPAAAAYTPFHPAFASRYCGRGCNVKRGQLALT